VVNAVMAVQGNKSLWNANREKSRGGMGNG